MADQPDWLTSVTSKATTQTLYNSVQVGGGLVSLTVPVDLSSWASVYININPGAITSGITWAWTDSTGTIILKSGLLQAAPGSGGGQFALQVVSATLQLSWQTNSAAPVPNVQVIGSSVPLAADAFASSGFKTFALNTAWTAGTPLGLGYYNSNGKPTYAVAAVGGATTKGYFGFFYNGAGNVQAFAVLTDTGLAHTDAGGSTSIDGLVYIPPGLVQIAFYPETTATYNAQIALTPTT